MNEKFGLNQLKPNFFLIIPNTVSKIVYNIYIIIIYLFGLKQFYTNKIQVIPNK